MVQMTWAALTPHQKASQVQELVQTKGYTASEAAKALGTTRNAVIGVMDRNFIRPGSNLKSKRPSAEHLERKSRAGRIAMERNSTAAAIEKTRRARAASMAPAVPSTSEETTGRKLLAPDAWSPLPGSSPTRARDKDGCCWPIGDGRPFLWCNLPQADGRYCTEHLHMSRSPAWHAAQKEKGK
jgi:hypothetical protein